MPAGFDPEPFLKHAKIAFVRVQAAFDQADYDTLGDLLTPENHIPYRCPPGAQWGPADIMFHVAQWRTWR